MKRSLFENRAEPAAFARILLERGIDDPRGLTYALDASDAAAAIGDRVDAPLGRGDASVGGYIAEISTLPPEGLDPDKIKFIRRRTGQRLPEPLLRLAEWMSRYYCCPPGMVLATMAPAAVRRQVGQREALMVEPTGAAPAGPLATKQAEAWERISSIPRGEFPMPARALARRIETRGVGPINRLVERGLLREVKRRIVRAEPPPENVTPDTIVTLTPEQQAAADRVGAALGGFAPFLLRGVTGSGKTEVYLRIIERAIARGDSALLLVPEISLTPQTTGRLRARFAGVGMAVLHSGLTDAQRHAEWARVASGEARLVAGARSAIFAPFPGRLGVVIVDEEHDESYKQDQQPRHHARDVAVKRAQIEGCPVVLASATPSLESWKNAVDGRYTLLELTQRVGGGALPRVQIVDMAGERRARPWTDRRIRLLGPTLERAVGETLDDGGQVILLLNRRGFANYICCPDGACGWTLGCSRCDTTMVLHVSRADADRPARTVVRCHHCLEEQTLPDLCPQCGKRVSVFGLGTQRVEDELIRAFPSLVEGETMLRIDADTMRSAKDFFRALDRFAKREARLLVGTQMLAKGHDFPGVRLVGVVHADTAINLPDFRAAERTFQLVSQVAGRAGRADERGRVIVQTLQPDAPPIRFAAAHDYRAFAADELALRERVGLPPFGRMARIVCRDEDLAEAAAAAAEIAGALREEAAATPPGDRPLVRGPMPCPLSRIAGQHRVSVEVLARSTGAIQRSLTACRNRGLLRSDASTAVDVDPVAML